MSEERIADKSAILALAGIVLLNQPLLTLFGGSSQALVLSVPPLYLYIFGVWGLVILAQYLIVRSSPPSPDESIEATPGTLRPRPEGPHEETP